MNDISNLTSSLDLSRLLLVHSGLSAVSAISPRSTGYNLPIALFGLLVLDRSSSEGLRQFGALHALSLVLDVLWLISGSRETGSLITFILLANMFLKPVTLLAISSNLKQQGLPNIGAMGPGGTTVWSADEGPAYHQSTPYHSSRLNNDDEEIEERLSQPPRIDVPTKQGTGGYQSIA